MYITEKKNNRPINFNFDMIQSRNIKDFSSNSPLSYRIYLFNYLFIYLPGCKSDSNTGNSKDYIFPRVTLYVSPL